MKSVLRILSVVVVFGAGLAKVHHHHHQDLYAHNPHQGLYAHNPHHGLYTHTPHHHGHSHGHGGLGYRTGYTTLLSSAPVVAKAPVVVSKTVAAVPAVAPAPVAYLGGHSHHHGHHAHANHYHAGVVPAYAYAAPIGHEHVALLSAAGKPKVYGQSIPAAAIRNVETVMVTKTITPVVTKTTTHHTRAEPALSLGHVQGYNQAAVGNPKVAPVQFNTAYTSYANPTVGVNGPVVYSGPAVGLATGYAVAPAGAAIAAGGVAPAPAYIQGAALGYDTYGLDAHSVPITNFLELRTGKPVLTAAAAVPYGYGHGHKK